MTTQMTLNVANAVEAGLTLGQAQSLPETVVAHKPHRFIRHDYSDNHRRHDLLGYILKTFKIKGEGPDYETSMGKSKLFKTDPIAKFIAEKMLEIIQELYPQSNNDVSLVSDISSFNDNIYQDNNKSSIAQVWKMTMEAIGYELEVAEEEAA